MKPLGSVVLMLLAALALTACSSGGPSGDPVTVVRQAMQLVEQGQYEDVADLACADKRDEIAGDLGLGQALPEGLPPGLTAEDFASAFTIGTDDLTVAETDRTADGATVHVEGTMTVMVDRQRLADLVRAAGLPVDEEFLGQIVDGIGEQLEDGIPIDEDLAVINEGGTWKIC